MLSKNHPTIIYIDRFGFSLYQDVLPNVAKFNFTPDLVSNMDVVNREQFVNLILTFIQMTKIVPGSLAVILSDDVIYIKDLVDSAQKTVAVPGLKPDPSIDKEHEEDVQNFLEDIPFEEVLAKVIKIGTSSRIVAVNKDLVMAIVNTLVGKGFTIEAIVPGFMYGQTANFSAGLTLDIVRVILENLEILRSGNLLTNQEKMLPTQSLGEELSNSTTESKPDSSTGSKKPRSLGQFILIGVFITLLVILAVVYLNMGASQALPKSYKIKNTSAEVNEGTAALPTAIISNVIPSLAQSQATTSSADLKAVTVKISYGAQSAGIAASLKTGLSGIGISNILEDISEVSIPEKSSIVFSQNVSPGARIDLIAEVRKILPNFSVLESKVTGSVVNILIGKS